MPAGRATAGMDESATELKEWDPESVPAASYSETASCTVSSRPRSMRTALHAPRAHLQRGEEHRSRLPPRATGAGLSASAARARPLHVAGISQASAPLRHRARGSDSDGDQGAPLRATHSKGAPPRAAPECESFRLCEAYVASLGLPDGTFNAAGNRCYCRQPGSHPHAQRAGEGFILQCKCNLF